MGLTYNLCSPYSTCREHRPAHVGSHVGGVVPPGARFKGNRESHCHGVALPARLGGWWEEEDDGWFEESNLGRDWTKQWPSRLPSRTHFYETAFCSEAGSEVEVTCVQPLWKELFGEKDNAAFMGPVLPGCLCWDPHLPPHCPANVECICLFSEKLSMTTPS